MKKSIKIISTILSWLLLAAMVLCIAGLVITKISGGEPEIIGYRIFVVSTGSMEPTLKVGDVILSKSFHTEDELTEGQIITYYGTGDTEGMLVTHRLVSVSGTNGNRTLILQGDANNVADAPISESNVVAIEKTKLVVFGKIFSIMQSKLGIPILILIILVFIVAESLDFSKMVKKSQLEKQKNEEK